MFKKILIANRGEIACRILKTARRLGVETVAVYSDVDRDSLAVSQADNAIYIGDSKAHASYLNVSAIIDAALVAKVEAIHPGYGFLSENPQFAKACQQAGIIFIGPTVEAMQAMASKQTAKQLLEKTDVPLMPGYHGEEQSESHLYAESIRIGFPVLLKPAAGGGGKGMQVVQQAEEFSQALASARRIAKASFGDDTIIIEKFITNPRHIEMQIMADNHGNIVHLFERDCSLQRRHQKIIEEAPALHLSQGLREKIANSAVLVAQAIAYRGAGTIEFLVSGEHCYFLEMNTRLQVEHPVTECITGLDLVEWQLRIAAGEKLPRLQPDITMQGHAIECRIYAEDPLHEFMPSIGDINFLQEPSGDGIRLDSGVEQGSKVSAFYDPMIAKLITWGENREQALQRMQWALAHYYIGGIKSNIPFLQSLIEHPQFQQAKIDTHFLSRETVLIPHSNDALCVLIATAVDYLTIDSTAAQHSLRRDTFAWQMHLTSKWVLNYQILSNSYKVIVTPHSPHHFTLKLDDREVTWHAKMLQQQLFIDNGQQIEKFWVSQNAQQITVYTSAGPQIVKRYRVGEDNAPLNAQEAQMTAPMPATIVAIMKQKGEKVHAGEAIMILEAMKMEHTIRAPKDGILLDIFYDVGDQVQEGTELIKM